LWRVHCVSCQRIDLGMSPTIDPVTIAVRPVSPSSNWTDDCLVQACLTGNDEAWAALIDKYKNLIYIVPIRGGCSAEDAADIFQAVCLELFSELPRLRRIQSLRSWLLTVANHKLFHHRKQNHRSFQSLDAESAAVAEPAALPAVVLEEIEHTHRIREIVAKLPERCQRLVQLLFYEHPPRSYADVARQLGVATSSIGFIRGRCLAKLEQYIRRAGLL
jgi:RNA polymerase sigma factor (sigma-70 family)